MLSNASSFSAKKVSRFLLVAWCAVIFGIPSVVFILTGWRNVYILKMKNETLNEFIDWSFYLGDLNVRERLGLGTQDKRQIPLNVTCLQLMVFLTIRRCNIQIDR